MAEQGRAVCFIGAPLCPLVSAVLARGVCAEIPLFFYAAEIAAAKMLLFLRESARMDILTKLGVVSKLEVTTIATEFFESPRDRPVSGRYCKRQNTFSGVHLIESGGG